MQYDPADIRIPARPPRTMVVYGWPLKVELAELHGDLFSRHASPLEGHGFVVVDDAGEDSLSDEISRRCNPKQQKRKNSKKGGVAAEVYSPQTGMFMILTFMRVCKRRYYIDEIYSARKQKRKKRLRSARDGHTCRTWHVCKSSGPI